MTERRRDVTPVLLDLGRALHEAGTPAHRIEDTVSAVAAGAGIQAQIFSTPTLILCTFGTGENTKTLAFRVAPAEYNLGRMVEVDTALEAVARGELPPEEALARISAGAGSAYPRPVIAFSHAMQSYGCAEHGVG
ncbi:MAG: threonine/serine exporter family protein, partial [Myxococcota bacterium]